MHRSGTSALTRALGLLGAEMGSSDHLGRHWENRHLRNVNTRLLDSAGGAWDSPPAWVKIDQAGADGLPDMASARIRQVFGSADVAVWKDPRTCLTLPFWLPLIGEDPVIVLIHRHPYEVARSLETRNRFSAGLSFALWERYNVDALRFAAGRPTTVLKYADVVGRPQAVMTEVVQHLRDCGIDLPNDPAATDMEFEADARHHVSASDEVLDHPVATESQRVVFDLLSSVGGSSTIFQPPAELPAAHPLSEELMRAAGKLRRVRKRHQQASRGSGAGGRRAKEATPAT